MRAIILAHIRNLAARFRAERALGLRVGGVGVSGVAGAEAGRELFHFAAVGAEPVEVVGVDPVPAVVVAGFEGFDAKDELSAGEGAAAQAAGGGFVVQLAGEARAGAEEIEQPIGGDEERGFGGAHGRSSLLAIF